jgi:hypothetical protein
MLVLTFFQRIVLFTHAHHINTLYNAVLPQLLSAIHSNLIINLRVTNVEISTKFDIPEPVGPNIIMLLFSKTSFCVVLSSMSAHHDMNIICICSCILFNNIFELKFDIFVNTSFQYFTNWCLLLYRITTDSSRKSFRTRGSYITLSWLSHIFFNLF